jgi:predicted esterase YcpF (UPF0227 family)
MSDASDTRDKVIKLETELAHLRMSVDHMAAKVDQMHELLQQAKGARWIILLAASLGGFLAGKVAWLAPWFGGLSK